MKIESAAKAEIVSQSIKPLPKDLPLIHEQSLRKNLHKDLVVNSVPNQKKLKVPPTEIQDKIREISKGGLYSVRFEKSDKIDELIVTVVDRQTDEVIFQIPPEEILGMRVKMFEIKGNIVRSEG